MDSIYTRKQLELMKLWQNGGLKRINLLEGSVSSGKTWISLVLWAFWVASMPKDKLYLMCGKSLTTLKRNCLLLLEELVGADNFRFSISSKEAYLFGRKIMLEGANDSRSESKIRGMTLQGAYCDELTLFPRDFFEMLLSRLRVSGAKLIATTNPDTPQHWLKKDFIDRQNEIDMLDIKFLLDDNDKLPADYIENLKKEYTGIFYERFILGLWRIAEGLIYPKQAQGANIVKTESRPYTTYYISMDYGTQNPCSMGLWGYYNGIWYRVKEYYYSGRDTKNQLSDDEYYTELEKLCNGLKIKALVIDPSAASFIALVKRKGKFKVIPAKNDVVNGIRFTSECLNSGRIMINDCCKDIIREFSLYCWNEKAADDRPVKENDHALDDMRYFCYTVLNQSKATVFDRHKLGIG